MLRAGTSPAVGLACRLNEPESVVLVHGHKGIVFQKIPAVFVVHEARALRHVSAYESFEQKSLVVVSRVDLPDWPVESVDNLHRGHLTAIASLGNFSISLRYCLV